MNSEKTLPLQIKDIAAKSENLSDFGLLLREWNHTLTRGDVSSRPAIARAIKEAPRILSEQFPEGNIADAYLAAYAEWIADKAGISRPPWTCDPRRSLEVPWFADNARASLIVLTPASFRHRNVFTIPEEVVHLRRGRPRVSSSQKKAKARARDRRYRQRVKEWIQKGRTADSLTAPQNTAH
ncbi:MAG: hypothetical protein JJU20_05585 [Opitutales bacterium]|nr:hypothetical protein [Opitutales bacterium]